LESPARRDQREDRQIRAVSWRARRDQRLQIRPDPSLGSIKSEQKKTRGFLRGFFSGFRAGGLSAELRHSRVGRIRHEDDELEALGAVARRVRIVGAARIARGARGATRGLDARDGGAGGRGGAVLKLLDDVGGGAEERREAEDIARADRGARDIRADADLGDALEGFLAGEARARGGCLDDLDAVFVVAFHGHHGGIRPRGHEGAGNIERDGAGDGKSAGHRGNGRGGGDGGAGEDAIRIRGRGGAEREDGRTPERGAFRIETGAADAIPDIVVTQRFELEGVGGVGGERIAGAVGDGDVGGTEGEGEANRRSEDEILPDLELVVHTTRKGADIGIGGITRDEGSAVGDIGGEDAINDFEGHRLGWFYG